LKGKFFVKAGVCKDGEMGDIAPRHMRGGREDNMQGSALKGKRRKKYMIQTHAKK